MENLKDDLLPKPQNKKNELGLWAVLVLFVITIGFILFTYIKEGSLTLDSIKRVLGNKESIAETKPIIKEEEKSTIPDDWKSFVIEDIGLQFSYPSTWGGASVKSSKGETGTTNLISFSKNDEPKILMGYATPDFTASRGGALYEGTSASHKNYTGCQIFRQSPAYQADSFVSCKDVTYKNQTLGVVISENNPMDWMSPGPLARAVYLTDSSIYPAVGISVQDNSSEMLTNLETLIRSFKAVDITSSWKTYENENHGFSLKYPGDWNIKSDRPTEIWLSTIVKTEDGDNYYSLWIDIVEYEDTLQNYIVGVKKRDEETKNQGGPSHNYGIETVAKIGNTSGYKFSNVVSMAQIFDQYFTKNSSTIYNIKVLKQAGDGPVYDTGRYIMTAENILGTLQFK